MADALPRGILRTEAVVDVKCMLIRSVYIFRSGVFWSVKNIETYLTSAKAHKPILVAHPQYVNLFLQSTSITSFTF
jgi:hypothetical protein